jgi:hypothetical protein
VKPEYVTIVLSSAALNGALLPIGRGTGCVAVGCIEAGISRSVACPPARKQRTEAQPTLLSRVSQRYLEVKFDRSCWVAGRDDNPATYITYIDELSRSDSNITAKPAPVAFEVITASSGILSVMSRGYPLPGMAKIPGIFARAFGKGYKRPRPAAASSLETRFAHVVSVILQAGSLDITRATRARADVACH